MEQLVDFLEETRKFEPKNDDKLQRLVKLLRRKELQPEISTEEVREVLDMLRA